MKGELKAHELRQQMKELQGGKSGPTLRVRAAARSEPFFKRFSRAAFWLTVALLQSALLVQTAFRALARRCLQLSALIVQTALCLTPAALATVSLIIADYVSRLSFWPAASAV